jgi:hypothetical protein
VEVKNMASERQQNYFALLSKELGKAVSAEQVAAFALLSVSDASAKISQLEAEKSATKVSSGPA